MFKTFNIKRYVNIDVNGNSVLKERNIKPLHINLEQSLRRITMWSNYSLFRPRTKFKFFNAIWWAALSAESLARERLTPGQGGNFFLEGATYPILRRAYFFAENRAIMYYLLKKKFKQLFMSDTRLFLFDTRNNLAWGVDGHFSIMTDWYKLEYRSRRRYRRFMTTALRINNWSYKRKNLLLSRSLVLYWRSLIFYKVLNKYAYTGLGPDGKTIINQ